MNGPAYDLPTFMRSACSLVPGNFLMFHTTFFSLPTNSALC